MYSHKPVESTSFFLSYIFLSVYSGLCICTTGGKGPSLCFLNTWNGQQSCLFLKNQPDEAIVLGLPPTLNQGHVCGCTEDSGYGEADMDTCVFWGVALSIICIYVMFHIWDTFFRVFPCKLLCNKEEKHKQPHYKMNIIFFWKPKQEH